MKIFKLLFNLLITMIFFNIAGCQQSPVNGFDVRIFLNTPVYQVAKAIEKEDTNAIKSYVFKNIKNLNFQDPKFGETLLAFAVINNKIISTKALLDLGANPNLKSFLDESTPFIDACRFSGILSKPEVMLKLLIQYGADVNSVQINHNSTQNDKKNFSKITALELVCFHGNLECFKVLVQNGANLDIYPPNEGSLVSIALLAGNLDIVRYLLIDKMVPIPSFCVIRQKGGKNELKLNIADLLNEQDYSSDLKKQKLKDEILVFLYNKIRST